MTVLPLELEGDLPEGFIPLEVVSIIKCLDHNGDPSLAVRQSGGLSEWEIIGMLTAGCDAARSQLTREFLHLRDEDPPDAGP